MPSSVIQYNLCPILTGTTQKEKVFTLSDDIAGPVDLTGATVKMQLKTSPEGAVEHEFSSTGVSPKFSIHLPLQGKFKLIEMVIDIEPFDYIYDLQVHLANGTQLTPLKGIYPIKSEITT